MNIILQQAGFTIDDILEIKQILVAEIKRQNREEWQSKSEVIKNQI